MERGEKSLKIISIGRQGGWQKISMGDKYLIYMNLLWHLNINFFFFFLKYKMLLYLINHMNNYLPESSLRNCATNIFLIFIKPLLKRVYVFVRQHKH